MILVVTYIFGFFAYVSIRLRMGCSFFSELVHLVFKLSKVIIAHVD